MALPHDYIAGLVDGEGCFSFRPYNEVKRHRKGAPVYFRWQAEFVIGLRADDWQLLELVRDSIGCGTVTGSRGAVRYSVQGINKLRNIIVPLFIKHPLHGKKQKDFELWSRAIEILYQHAGGNNKAFTKKPWEAEEIAKLKTYWISMREIKTNKRPTFSPQE